MPARFSLTTFFVLALATNAFAQCRVRGLVRDVDGSPMANATVRLQGVDLKQPLTTTADERGRYEFPSVTPGIRVQVVVIRDLREVAHAYTLVTLAVETVDLQAKLEMYEPTSLAAVLADSGGGGEVTGLVVAAGEPLVGARVTFGDSPLTTTTDAAGRFAFDGLRPGVRAVVHAAAPGYRLADKDVTIVEGQRIALDFALTEAQRSAESPAVSSPDASSVTSAEDPLTESGRLFRALSFLPGVEGGRTPATPPGQAPGEQRAIIAPRPLRTFSGSVDLNTTGAGGTLQVPLGPRASASVAVRRSLSPEAYATALDWFAPTSGTPVRDRVARFSGGTFLNAPVNSSFADSSATLAWAPAATDRLSLRVFDWSSDLNNSHDLSVPAPSTVFHAVAEPSLPEDAVVQVSDMTSGTSRGFGLLWRHAWNGAQHTTLSIDQFTNERGSSQAWLLQSPTAGDYSFDDARGGSQGLSESNRVKKTTVSVDHTVRIGFEHAVSVGGDVSSLDATYDLLTEVLNPPSGSIGSSLAEMVRRDDTTTAASVYAQDQWRPLARLAVTPGVRLLHDQRTASSFVEPRVNATYQLIPLVRLRGGWSVEHDLAPSIAREDLLHGDGSFQAIADGSTIPVVRTRTAAAGTSVDLPGGSIDATFFRLTFDGLTLFAPRVYPGVGPSDALFHQGTGDARGFDFRFHQVVARNTLTFGYVLSRATMTFPTLQAGSFDASNDRTHQFSLIESVALSQRWSASVSWTAASGQPYTVASALQPVWFPSGVGVDQVIFGAKNAARLPAYHHLDASTKYDIRFGAVVASIGVNAFNLYDHQNVLFEEYETAGHVVTPHDVTAMGRAVDAFVRIRF